MPKSSTSPQPSSLVKETANGKGKAARDIRKGKADSDNSKDKGNSKDNNKDIEANDNSKDKQREAIANSGVNTVEQALSQELKTTKSSTNVEKKATEQCMVENEPSLSCNVAMANNGNKQLTDAQVDKLLGLREAIAETQTRIHDHNTILLEHEEIQEKLHCSLRHLEDVQLAGDFQIMWKITDFKSKLRMSKDGERPSVYSPAFHTHDKGYSMGLSLCPYGDGEAYGTHMSIFFCILKGNWDALQSWPFNHTVTFTLMDLGPQQRHHTASLTPNPRRENMPFLGRPKMVRTFFMGLPKFIPLLTLRDGDFVRDDTMFIKVKVDLSGVELLT